MKNNKNKPSYNEAAKMFDIVDSYLCEVHNKGWNGMKLQNIYKNIGMMKSLMQIIKIVQKYNYIRINKLNKIS